MGSFNAAFFRGQMSGDGGLKTKDRRTGADWYPASFSEHLTFLNWIKTQSVRLIGSLY